VDAFEHRGHEGPDEAPRVRLRLVARGYDLPARLLSLNQWFFLKLYESDWAYRKKSRVNWCPQCATVLANEQVVGGMCWRHENQPVEQRELEQWFLRITKYADELLRDLDKLSDGRKKSASCSRTGLDAAKARWSISLWRNGRAGRIDHHRVHHARRHDLWRHFRATGAEHPLVSDMMARNAELRPQVEKMIAEQRRAKETGDIGTIEKHGVFTGRYAKNPYNGEAVPFGWRTTS